jgi:hypothetical protein
MASLKDKFFNPDKYDTETRYDRNLEVLNKYIVYC